jgi:2-(1,2-epoxy-1,2-dihydrophenyl)acetyl-CoA isomerase
VWNGRPTEVGRPFTSGAKGRSADDGLQGIPEIACFLGGEFDDQATATLERDPHDDAAALLRDLERTITRPRLHGRHRYTSSWVGDRAVQTIIAEVPPQWRTDVGSNLSPAPRTLEGDLVKQPVTATQVHLTRSGAVATITLDGPRSRNALSGATEHALLAAVREVAADDTVRAVVLTGANGAFTAGADLRELRASVEAGEPLDLGELLASGLNVLVTELAALDKPVLAAVPGAAAGAGLALALACDIRIAARSAVFATAFTGIGLTADAGLSWILPRIVGHARATAMLLLPERMPAERALDLGLVQAIVPDELLAPTAEELAARLAAGPTLAYAAVKRSLAYSATATLPETLAFEAREQRAMGYSADHQNAVASFLRREDPTFEGR